MSLNSSEAALMVATLLVRSALEDVKDLPREVTDPHWLTNLEQEEAAGIEGAEL